MTEFRSEMNDETLLMKKETLRLHFHMCSNRGYALRLFLIPSYHAPNA
jgi:hypothetical protein